MSFTKGCYTGQELVARLDARGNRVARHLRGLVADVAPDGPGWMAGAEVVAAGKTVGALTSTAWSPALGRPVALGYVHRSVEVSQPVEVRSAAGATTAEVRSLPMA